VSYWNLLFQEAAFCAFQSYSSTAESDLKDGRKRPPFLKNDKTKAFKSTNVWLTIKTPTS